MDSTLLNQATGHLREALGLLVTTNASDSTRLTLKAGGATVAFEIDLRRTLHAAAAASVPAQKANAGAPLLVVAERIQPAAAAKLRERGISYLDAAGNCHLLAPPLFVHVEGRKLREPIREEAVRAFAGEGIKVIFALLLDPGLAERPYRDLTRLTGVSIGAVQYTMRDLVELGFLVRLNRTTRRLRNVRALVDRWAVAYAEVLRPRLTRGAFRLASPHTVRDWASLPLDPATDRWGGEAAAALITDHLRPALLDLYSRSSRPEVMKRLRLLPDSDGALTLIDAFWPAELEQHATQAFAEARVPVLLAYGDLILSPDPRNADAAAHLRDLIVGTLGDVEESDA